ncbi:peptide MFS transporter [Xanthovirga aplysinae]|uniref:peptide MFS transporter n=1 Tax=Xanthovirga aplysinae TaxID=2529853 RepID=UPI0012BBDFD1|nr:peptide MFS transporter [Xanthovirga aplysinae]MTI31224.1 MFS transporter [Xanthovirga aplysinae]
MINQITKEQVTKNRTKKPDIPQVFGHPKGLIYLFFAELWERFSFYGMKAMLIIYMTSHLMYSDEFSFGVFASYGSLVYASPLIGGMLADKILGYRKAIILGGILMTLGHLGLAIETPLFFYGSLAIIVIGNGFFKPNISSLVGKLYKDNEEKKDGGFTLFYLGINLGAMLSPLLCAWLGVTYGWHYGFGLAGLGMITGLIVFYKGINDGVFGQEGLIPDLENFNRKVLGLNKNHLISICSFLCVPVVALLIYYHEFGEYLMWLILLGISLVLTSIFRAVNNIERQRLTVVIYFTILASLFWALFEQAGSSITLFADRNVNLIGINASQTNSIGSGFIILLAIPFAWLWTYLSKNNRDLNTPVKFAIGLFLLGIGFIIFGYSAQNVDQMGQTPMFYLFGGYFIYTVGEMFLSPIGLSKMTELSPPKYIGFIMGMWFLATSIGSFLSGKIAKMTTVSSKNTSGSENNFLDKAVELVTGLSQDKAQQMGESFQQLYSYVSTFTTVGLFAVALGILAFIISPFIKKLMHLENE